MEGRSPNFPHYWIFQFNPKKYNWFGWIKQKRLSEQWLVSRFDNIISEGDKVAIWASGKESGIYAIGKTITHPFRKPLNPEQAKYYRPEAKNVIDKFKEKSSISITYLKVFVEKPISKYTCKNDAVLSSLEILGNFTEATNFRIEKIQWTKILEMAQ